MGAKEIDSNIWNVSGDMVSIYSAGLWWDFEIVPLSCSSHFGC